MKMIKALVLALALGFSSVTTAMEVNINSADAETMAEFLTGIGMQKAKAIVDYRKENGNFTSVDELQKVPGIGSKTVEKNMGVLKVSSK